MTAFYYGLPHSVLSAIAQHKVKCIVWDQFGDNLHRPIAWPLLKACRA